MKKLGFSFILFFFSVYLIAQGESDTFIYKGEKLYTHNSFYENFDKRIGNVYARKKIGPSMRVDIYKGECKISYSKKGDGGFVSVNTSTKVLTEDSVQFEFKFKFHPEKRDRYFDILIGANDRNPPLKITLNEKKFKMNLQKGADADVYIKKSIDSIGLHGGYNVLSVTRINSEIILMMNGEVQVVSKYPVKYIDPYHGLRSYEKKLDRLEFFFIQPNITIDYIKIAKLKMVAPPIPITKDEEKPIISSTSKTDNNINREFNFSSSVKTANYSSSNQPSADFNPSGKYYALIIGNNDYLDPNISSLDQPVNDATNLANILINRYTFEKSNVLLLKNASRSEIIEAFDLLSNNLISNDNLVIFYAGHGFWDEKKETGYWLPVDAKKGSTANWLRNSTIQGYIDDITTKHTLLIADACFGGGIFKTRKAFNDAPPSIENLYKLPSRKGITSGMLNEVPDRSVFMEYLLKRLNDNSTKYLSSMDLFTSFRIAVMNNSSNTPQFGTIHNTGDEGGDFIFIRRSE